MLANAFVRRKQFEGMALFSALGRAMQEGGGSGKQRISAEAMLAMMGGF